MTEEDFDSLVNAALVLVAEARRLRSAARAASTAPALSQCIHCGEMSSAENMEVIRMHALTCEANPLVRRLAEVTADLDRLRAGSVRADASARSAPPSTVPFLTDRRVVAYTGRSLTTINRAVAAGRLTVAGRVGGVGERMFRREDVDAWLLGKSGRKSASTQVTPRLKGKRTSSAESSVEDALERIALTARPSGGSSGKTGGG